MANLTTSNIAIYQNYKLFIEGEECPFESVTISYGVGGIPEMIIQLVPYHILRKLGERTKAHLYFLDPIDGQLRLLFDGEIRGEGYIKTPSSRTLTYSVTHVSHYLDEILISFKDPWTFGLQSLGATKSPSSLQVYLQERATTNTIIEQYFSAASLKDVKGKSFHDFFKNFITLILSGEEKEINDISEQLKDSSISTAKKEKLEGQLKELKEKQPEAIRFFIAKAKEWNLFDRITVLPQQTGGLPDAAFTLEDFIKDEELLKFWREIGITTSGGVYSIFQLFNKVFQQIFYVPVVIPTPYYKGQALQSILYKPQSLFVSPPLCNVIWPSMYNSFSYSRDFKAQPTRMFARQRDTIFNSDGLVPANYIWAPSGSFKQFDESTGEARPVDIQEAMNTVVTSTGEDKVGVRLAQHQENDIVHRYINWLGQVKNPKTHKQVLKLVDYELIRQRLKTVSSSISMVFNPYIVPGFPCLIVDEPDSGMHVYGYVMAVTHNIHASGGSHTTADIGYLRQYDDKFTSTFPVADEVWADEDAVYKDIFGVSSIKSKEAQFNPTGITDHALIPQLIESKMREKEFYDFTYNAYARSHRKIITKDEYDSASFGTDLKDVYDAPTQDKVKEYRRWIVNRMAGAPPLDNSATQLIGTVQDTSGLV